MESSPAKSKSSERPLGAATEADAVLPAVLVIATGGETRGRVHQRLEEEFEVTMVQNLDQAMALLGRARFALTLFDLREGARPTEELAHRLRAMDGEMSVLALGAGRAVRLLGEQCLQVPFDSGEVVDLAHQLVDMALRRRGRSELIRELEDAVKILHRELEDKGAQSGMQEEASASMLHDLRNALCSTIGYTARLIQETDQLKTAVGDQALPVDHLAKKLEQTSNYLLHLAHSCRLDLGTNPKLELLDLQVEIEHVRAVLFFNSPNVIVNGQRTGAAGSRDVGMSAVPIRGDRYELHRVFQNLFKNAFEAGAEQVWATVRFDAAADLVWVEVVDDGRGFPEGFAERALREPLESSKRGGQGIGLRICRQIIERHGGRIELRETSGRGTTFVLQLPAR